MVVESFMWLLLLICPLVSALSTCRGIALEAGGSRGAYQVGAILGLTQLLPPEEVQWNVVAGVSTGALNAVQISLFPMGQEPAMVEFMQNVWLALNGSSSVYENWNEAGPLYGLLFEPSLFSSASLRHTLETFVTHAPLRNLTLGTCDISTAEFTTFTESVGTDLVDAVMCSTASAVFFPPHTFQGRIWIDGGIVVMLDVASAIDRCLEVVDTEEQVTIDMILCSATELAPLKPKLSVYDVWERVSAIKKYDSSMWTVFNAKQAHPRVNFRYTIVPSERLPGGVEPLDFNKTNLVDEMELGLKDVYELVDAGRTVSDGVHEWRKSVTAFSRGLRR